MTLTAFEKSVKHRAIDAIGYEPYVMRVCQRHRKWKWSTGMDPDALTVMADWVAKLKAEFANDSKVEVEETYALGRATMTFMAVEVRALRK